MTAKFGGWLISMRSENDELIKENIALKAELENLHKINEWQSLETYKGQEALLGFWCRNRKTGQIKFEFFQLYVDDEYNLRTADGYDDYFSEYTYKDIDCWRPLPTPPESEG